MMVAAAEAELEAEAEVASAKYSRPRSFLRGAATSANETTRERASKRVGNFFLHNNAVKFVQGKGLLFCVFWGLSSAP